MKIYLFFLGLCPALLLSCQKKSCPDPVKASFVDATGTDGCGMLIELGNGQLLEPRNLDDFDIEPENGAKIWVNYHPAQSGATVCMIGDVVVIDCIVKR